MFWSSLKQGNPSCNVWLNQMQVISKANKIETKPQSCNIPPTGDSRPCRVYEKTLEE
jgi:hypothetical protein